MVGKVKVVNPVRPVLRDLTDPRVIDRIWSEAARVVAAEAPALRRRQVRAARRRAA